MRARVRSLFMFVLGGVLVAAVMGATSVFGHGGDPQVAHLCVSATGEVTVTADPTGFGNPKDECADPKSHPLDLAPASKSSSADPIYHARGPLAITMDFSQRLATVVELSLPAGSYRIESTMTTSSRTALNGAANLTCTLTVANRGVDAFSEYMHQAPVDYVDQRNTQHDLLTVANLAVPGQVRVRCERELLQGIGIFTVFSPQIIATPIARVIER